MPPIEANHSVKSQADSLLNSSSHEEIAKTTKSKKPKVTQLNVQPLDFPKYIANITDSLSYTKKLVVTAISSILYLRGLFSEKYFVDRKFEDMTFKIIKPPSKNLCETGIIAQWLHGSFDALDKKYLKCISLSFYENPDDNKNVLETYEFGISYNGENVELTLNTTDAKKAAKKAKMNAFRLLRTIIFTSGTLVDLPVKICVTMRLFYYEDVTPVEYEPNGFESSDFEKYTFQNGHIRIDGNKASTQWHEATFNINVDNSMIKQMNDLEKINETFDHGSNFGENDSGMETIEGTKFKYIKDKTVDKLLDQTTFDTTAFDLSLVEKAVSQISSRDSDIEIKINCCCRLKDTAEDLYLLRCETCKDCQHAICYNVLLKDEKELKSIIKNFKHNCFSCHAKNNDLALIDKLQEENSDTETYELSIWRRLLHWLTTIPYEKEWLKINEIAERFEAIPSLINRLVNDLESIEILYSNKSKNKKNKAYRIDQAALKDYNIKNFQTVSQLEASNSQKSGDIIFRNNPNKSVCFDLPNKSKATPNKASPNQNPSQVISKSDKKKIKVNCENMSDDDLEKEIQTQLSPKRQRKSSISIESLNFN